MWRRRIRESMAASQECSIRMQCLNLLGIFPAIGSDRLLNSQLGIGWYIPSTNLKKLQFVIGKVSKIEVAFIPAGIGFEVGVLCPISILLLSCRDLTDFR